ncbi:MAG: polysaccharide deacetylase family protein [Oscillospiraceae bacterium]|nr:polysaccharide deacetylase family protein [Oscillospiraceae bacterium]
MKHIGIPTKIARHAAAILLTAALCFAFAACRDGVNEQPPETMTPTAEDLPPISGGDYFPTSDYEPTDPNFFTTTGAGDTSLPGGEPQAPVAGGPAQAFPAPTVLMGQKDPAAKTYTGLRPLEVRPIEMKDPNNSKNLPVTKVAHSFGAAKDGQVHQISKNYQTFFDQKQYPAVVYDNRSAGKTLYLTFDCGYENGNTAKILDVLKEKQTPAAFFCTIDEMKSAPEVVARMIGEGHIVGNHSVTHPSFAAIDRAAMAKEVLEADNYLRKNFGYSAPFFRFPMGEYTESALEAVGSLGFTSVFWSAAYSDWDVNQQKGAQYARDTVLSRLHPGAIVLLHSVSNDNAEAMAQIIDRAREEGYTFRKLTDLPIFLS